MFALRIHNLRSREPVLFFAGLAHLTLFLVLLVLGVLGGMESGWVRPAKFVVSIGIYLITLGMFLLALPDHFLKTALRWGFTLSALIETILILTVAFRGISFMDNPGQTLDTALFSFMEWIIYVNALLLSILLIWLVSTTLPNLSMTLQTGMILGVFITLVGSFIGHAALFDPMGEGFGIFVSNWNQLSSDVQVGQFMALHSFQILPILAWIFEEKLKSRYSIALIIITGIFYFTFLMYVFLLGDASSTMLEI